MKGVNPPRFPSIGVRPGPGGYAPTFEPRSGRVRRGPRGDDGTDGNPEALWTNVPPWGVMVG